MKKLICLIIAGLAMTLISNAQAASETSSIRIKSKLENRSYTYIAGNFAAFRTQTIIEVWNFLENKKIATLTFEDLLSKIPELEIKKKLEMNKKLLIKHISLSGDGDKVAITQTDGSVILWKTKSNEIIPLIQKNVRGTNLSQSGRFIGMLNEREKSFSIVDLEKNKEVISMTTDAGDSGFIEFSQNENNVYVGISNFLLGYELKTGNNTIKIKLPSKFNVSPKSSVGFTKSVISADGRFLVCPSSFGRAVLIELSPEGKTKILESMNYFFTNDALITDSFKGDFKKIDFKKIDEFMKTSKPIWEDEALFPVVNIPIDKMRPVHTIVNSTYYSFQMKDELGETIVNIIKTSF